MDSKKVKAVIIPDVTYEEVEKVFERETVSKRYEEIRNCEAVKQHFESILNELKEKAEGDQVIQMILEDNGGFYESIEANIKKEITQKAVEQLIKNTDVASFDEAIISIINEANLKEVISCLSKMAEEVFTPFSNVIRGMGILDAIMSSED